MWCASWQSDIIFTSSLQRQYCLTLQAATTAVRVRQTDYLAEEQELTSSGTCQITPASQLLSARYVLLLGTHHLKRKRLSTAEWCLHGMKIEPRPVCSFLMFFFPEENRAHGHAPSCIQSGANISALHLGWAIWHQKLLSEQDDSFPAPGFFTFCSLRFFYDDLDVHMILGVTSY